MTLAVLPSFAPALAKLTVAVAFSLPTTSKMRCAVRFRKYARTKTTSVAEFVTSWMVRSWLLPLLKVQVYTAKQLQQLIQLGIRVQ